MNEIQVRSWMRGECNKMGWTLLLYNLIMSSAVTAVCMVDSVIRMVIHVVTEPIDGVEEDLYEVYMDALNDSLMSNGWGYILAMLAGAGILLLWKRRDFCFRVIWQDKKRMTFGSFMKLLVLFISGQAVFQVLAVVMEAFFNIFGLSLLESIENASGLGTSFSMFLYAGVFAPIGEEILFRGLILRTLEPMGKKFAILASAVLFGLFHGNFIQSPYAFVVGLVLGYTAVEYSIGWAMVLHMVNNLILGDVLTRLAELLPEGLGDGMIMALIWGCTLAAIIVLVTNRKGLRSFRDIGRIHPWALKSFFTSPGILVLAGYMMLNMVLLLFM